MVLRKSDGDLVTTPAFTNRLINEKSPYLLQHAHNPVDWYPWGEEAFERARREEKPIFLSIGYATCHWCHVMETESFENPEVAKLMNETFVNIKVDREEHPEVDSIYMEFAQALMSSPGGWPLNVVLTPDLKPFFAVTYLPPSTRKGIIGIDQFAKQIQALWSGEERTHLVAQADKIVELFAKSAKTKGEDLPSEELLDAAVQMLFDTADPVYGGIRGEPKFPLGYQANLLLQYSKAKNDSRALFYVDLTLEMMARGGLYDHLGGGFSRYCVDERWRIPHFEKMLYDNAILAETYLQAYKFTKKQRFGTIVRGVCDFVLREMTSPEGGFYSAQDADSEGHEGRFYTWTRAEIEELLPAQDAELFCKFYGVTQGGNFEGRNVLFMEMGPQEFASAIGLSQADLESKLESLKKILFEKRKTRVAPFKDDKIITSWNGLMIDALAKAGSAFGEKSYTESALKSATFIKEKLMKDGRLLHRYRDQEARFNAGLEDYAYLIRALLTLFELGQGTQWLEWAVDLTSDVETHFKSPEGAFYQCGPDPHLLIRKCEFYDGAEPSGNAIHCENLLRLYQLTQNEKYLTQAEEIFKAVKGFIEAFPPGACYHLIALQRYLDTNAPMALFAFSKEEPFEQEIQKVIGNHFSPHATFAWKSGKEGAIDALMPYAIDQLPIEGEPALYICRGSHCEPPIRGKEAILNALQKL